MESIETEKVKKRINLDDILIKELGEFGLFQFRTLLLILISVIFGAWAASEYVFTTARIRTRIQGQFGLDCDESIKVGRARATDFLLLWTSGIARNLVLYFTIVQFDLGCDEWRRSMIGSLRTLGSLDALPITGFISDRFGRRMALAFNSFNLAWLGAIRYVASSYNGFVISQLVEAMFGFGAFSCAYVIATEIVGPKYRVAAGATISTFFSVGQVLMGLIAWAVPDWKTLTLTLYVPQIITIGYLWLISESVRWYLSKGHYDKAEKVLKKIAKVNNRQLSEKSLELLSATAEEEKQNALRATTEKSKEPWLVVLVWRNKSILLRCVVSLVWWIAVSFIYNGMAVNAVNMSGNPYMNYMAVTATQIPGYWAVVLLLDRIGRRPVLIMAFWIGAACQTAYIFIPGDMPGASLAVYLIGTFSSAMTMTAVYVYTLELYPTRYRHSLFGFSSMIGRLGAILAPLTPAMSAAVWDKLPFALFAGLALLSGAFVFLTPETLGTALPDTLEQAAEIGISKNERVGN